MIDVSKDIHSLTDFKRNTAEFMEQLKQTGHPLVLTVNGKAELIVQDAASYQQLLDALERADAVRGIDRGLDDVKHGRTQPAHEAFEEIRRKFKIPQNAKAQA